MPLRVRELVRFFKTPRPPTNKDAADGIRKARKGAFDYKTNRGIGLVGLSHLTRIKKKILQLIAENGATPEKPVRILDVGCGSGQFPGRIKKQFGDLVEVHAVDVFRRPPWKTVDGVHFHIGHAEGLQRRFARDFFHLVISTYGLCYTPNQLAALEQAQTITKRNGWIVVHVHNGVLKRRQKTNVNKIAKVLGARITRFPPVPGHPIYSIQFRKKPAVIPLQE